MQFSFISSNIFKFFTPVHTILRGTKSVSKSLVPELKESDLKEHFIKGGGPGGQKVNKSVNCVFLMHKPTGLNVKVHESRLLEENRKIARERLTTKLDNFLNGENSVENQKKRILEEKTRKRDSKKRKLSEMKRIWKENLANSE